MTEPTEKYDYHWQQRELGKRVEIPGGLGEETNEPGVWRDIPEGETVHLTPEIPRASARKVGDDMVVTGDGSEVLRTDHPHMEDMPAPEGIIYRKIKMRE